MSHFNFLWRVFALQINETRKLAAFFRHDASSLFYFPQHAVYFILFLLNKQVFINHVQQYNIHSIGSRLRCVTIFMFVIHYLLKMHKRRSRKSPNLKSFEEIWSVFSRKLYVSTITIIIQNVKMLNYLLPVLKNIDNHWIITV